MKERTSHVGLFTHGIQRYYNMVDFAGSFHEYDVALTCVKPPVLPPYLNLVQAFDSVVWGGVWVRYVGMGVFEWFLL